MNIKRFAKIQFLVGLAIMLVPFLAHAQQGPTNFTQVVQLFIDLLKTAIPLIVGLALLVFFWGLVKFISTAGDVKSHDAGRSLMIWGIIGLFVMISIWGILQFLGDQLGFTNNGSTSITTLPQ